MYEINDILTLSDNNKYIIVNKLFYKNKFYYMLLDYDDDNIWFIVYEEGKTLDLEENEEVIYDVITKFETNEDFLK